MPSRKTDRLKETAEDKRSHSVNKEKKTSDRVTSGEKSRFVRDHLADLFKAYVSYWFNNGISHTQLGEIYEGVAIDSRAWTNSFKNFVEKPIKNYGYGSRKDDEFIRDAAVVLWGDKLKTHSVSGKQANTNLKKNANAKPAGPPLPTHEVEEIIHKLTAS